MMDKLCSSGCSSTYRSDDFQCDLISNNGGVSMRDVGKRTSVYEYRGSLNSLCMTDDDDDRVKVPLT